MTGTATTIVVTECWRCPARKPGTSSMPWCAIADRDFDDDDEGDGIPEWCPLRKGAVVVRLTDDD